MPPDRCPLSSQRQRTLEVLLALLGRLAERQPVLVIVEDLHWVDPSTCELLGLLIDQVPTICIYIVLTCRPEFQAPGVFACTSHRWSSIV
jgi:predicted ATPase